MSDNCTTCKYKLFDGRDYSCRRNPPQLFLVPQGPGQITKVAFFPVVYKLIWCGEYRKALEIFNPASIKPE